MAVTDYAGIVVECLSSDTKPDRPNGWYLKESDTGKRFHRQNGAWVEVNPYRAMPSHIGQTNKYLKSDGTDLSWQTVSGGSAVWGDITGTLSNQTDLNSALGGKASSSHSHAESEVTNLTTDLGNKVDKITGKGLSTNDYTTAEQTKLSGIETGANNYSHPANHAPSIITQDASNRFVTDTEKSTWNGKEAGGAVSTHAALKTGAHGLLNSVRIRTQVTPTAKTSAVTLTIAELLTGIITGNPAAAAAYTLPTGTLCEGGVTMAVDEAFEWVLSNIATTATYIITLTAATGHTIVGCPKVPSNSTTTGGLWGTASATFRTRKTATNTFVTYRIG